MHLHHLAHSPFLLRQERMQQNDVEAGNTNIHILHVYKYTRILVRTYTPLHIYILSTYIHKHIQNKTPTQIFIRKNKSVKMQQGTVDEQFRKIASNHNT